MSRNSLVRWLRPTNSSPSPDGPRSIAASRQTCSPVCRPAAHGPSAPAARGVDPGGRPRLLPALASGRARRKHGAMVRRHSRVHRRLLPGALRLAMAHLTGPVPDAPKLLARPRGFRLASRRAGVAHRAALTSFGSQPVPVVERLNIDFNRTVSDVRRGSDVRCSGRVAGGGPPRAPPAPPTPQWLGPAWRTPTAASPEPFFPSAGYGPTRCAAGTRRRHSPHRAARDAADRSCRASASIGSPALRRLRWQSARHG